MNQLMVELARDGRLVSLFGWWVMSAERHRQPAKGRDEQTPQLMNEFELFFSFVVGYGRLAAIMLRKKEKTKTIQMK